MIDLKTAKIEDFKCIKASPINPKDMKIKPSFFKVKPGSYVIPRKEHRITKLPEGVK